MHSSSASFLFVVLHGPSYSLAPFSRSFQTKFRSVSCLSGSLAVLQVCGNIFNRTRFRLCFLPQSLHVWAYVATLLCWTWKVTRNSDFATRCRDNRVCAEFDATRVVQGLAGAGVPNDDGVKTQRFRHAVILPRGPHSLAYPFVGK
jgi:hypothetical protein